MNVYQLLSGAGPVDAVTGQARAYRACFERWGWGGSDHAAYIDPRVGRGFDSFEALAPRSAGDVLVFHYSAYAPRLAAQLARPQRKLVISHNITPARWFWEHEPMTAVQCAIGREQLPRFARAADVAAGVSEYNAAELGAAGARATAVVPILFDPARWPSGRGGAAPDGAPRILSVGRVAPHKRHDLVIRAFALYRRERARDAELAVVGEPLTEDYRDALRALADRLAPGAVHFESQLSAAALAERYRHAGALLSLSEHEGFCIPLLEAFRFDVPVVARPLGGAAEVAADAVLPVPEPVDVGLVAELLHRAVSDRDLRAVLRERGARQLERYRLADSEAALHAAVMAAAGTQPR